MDVKLRAYKKDLDYSYAIGVFPTLELLDARPEHVLQV
ncbi:MAG: TrmH family RNA methyltransferase, partial [Chloroflexi bacterium]|nr:TrmH family RNA methyltransferase [Chloroflexota bacterium]